MKISANIQSSHNLHETTVRTDNDVRQIQIAPKASGLGSSVNGGELLALALATCFCNDIYREAAKRNINVTRVEIEVTSEFGAEGETGKNFHYKANINADASPEEITALIHHTDKVAEIQNTLRKGVNVNLIM